MESRALDILQAPAALRRELESLKERLSTYASIQMTVRYGAKTAQTGRRGGIDDWMVECLALSEEAEKCERALISAQDEAEHLLQAVRDQPVRIAHRSAVLLRLRYCTGLDWPEIREALMTQGYAAGCIKTVYNWHRSALELANRAAGIRYDTTGRVYRRTGGPAP